MRFTGRWRWWGLGLLLIVTAGGLLRWQPWRDDGPSEALTAVAAAASAVPATPWSGMRLLAPTGAGAAAAPGHAGSGVDPRLGAVEGSVEVCGARRVRGAEVENWNPVTGAAEPDWMRAMNLRKSAAMSALAARLAVGSDGERTAARLLMGDTEGAAAIAVRSQDAQAYRLALARCGFGAEVAPHCRGLNAQGWAQRDPEDGRPWLALAGEAMARRDEAAAGQALEQALARRKRSPSSPLLALAVNARAGVKDDAGLGMAMVEIIGVEAAVVSYESVGARYCSAEGLKEVSRRQRCERLARWQFEHADTLLDAMMALGVADRVGLPTAQRPYTRERLTRGLEWVAEQSIQVIGYDCASLRRTADFVAKQSRQGELQMVLEAAGPP